MSAASKSLPILATLLCFVAFATAATPTKGPRSVVQQTIDEVLSILRDASLDLDQRRQRIKEIAYERFDWPTTARLVLARDWRRFSLDQQHEFVREFREYLALNYGDRIERYEQEEVEIIGERTHPRGDVTIETKVMGGEFSGALVDYRLREKDGDWRVIDVTVEGISLVSNYRDQFRAVISNGGPEHLLSRLREKNESGVPDE